MYAKLRAASAYAELCKAVRDYDKRNKDFMFHRGNGRRTRRFDTDEQWKKDVKLLVRPDARIPDMELQTDLLVKQMEHLMLVSRKARKAEAKMFQVRRVIIRKNLLILR